MSLRLDHIGYAVENIERYVQEFMVPLMAPLSVGSILEDPLQKVRLAMVTLAGGVRIELIQPLTADSPVSARLQTQAGGLYHLAYSVPDLDKAMEAFRARRCWRISGPVPAPLFEGRRVAFFFTPQHDLIELVEEGP